MERYLSLAVFYAGQYSIVSRTLIQTLLLDLLTHYYILTASWDHLELHRNRTDFFLIIALIVKDFVFRLLFASVLTNNILYIIIYLV